MKIKVCKYCEQTQEKCPCAKLDAFFGDCWDLMFTWPAEEPGQEAKAS